MLNKYEHITQRDENFKGGIKKGTTATDIYSKSLDETLKNLREEIYQEIKHLGFYYRKAVDKKLLREKGITIGFVPDGGIWYKNDVAVVIFEAKKQGKGGNAIERWCKNYSIAKFLFNDVRYVTFGSREGFEIGSYPERFAKSFLMMEDSKKEVNKPYAKGQTWILSPNGFSKIEIKEKMIKLITGEGIE
jgi:hypothetical protein